MRALTSHGYYWTDEPVSRKNLEMSNRLLLAIGRPVIIFEEFVKIKKKLQIHIDK